MLSLWQRSDNQDMFDEAGLAYPDDEWLCDDYLANAQKLTKQDARGRTSQYGTISANLMQTHWSNFLWANGGRILNDDRTKYLPPAALPCTPTVLGVRFTRIKQPNSIGIYMDKIIFRQGKKRAYSKILMSKPEAIIAPGFPLTKRL